MSTEFNLDRQIASEPQALREILDEVDVPALDPGRPIVFTGIGTSLHAARVATDWTVLLTGGRVRPRALDAHDVGTWMPLRREDQVVVISHRGTKAFPTAALARARAAGCSTVAIVGRAAPPQDADHTLRTCANETAGTFTVSYLSSLVVLGRLVAGLDPSPEQAFAAALDRVPEAVERTLALGDPAAVAARIARAETVLIIGFGADLPTAQEAALKIKEGAWLWTEAMSPEFALHGTPAGYRPGMAALLIDPGQDDGGRTGELRAAFEDLGVTTHRVSTLPGCELCFETPAPLLRPVTSIVPLQRLTAALARVRATDPDTMHGGREPWRTVMTAIRL